MFVRLLADSDVAQLGGVTDLVSVGVTFMTNRIGAVTIAQNSDSSRRGSSTLPRNMFLVFLV